jgi:hypothetical protein
MGDGTFAVCSHLSQSLRLVSTSHISRDIPDKRNPFKGDIAFLNKYLPKDLVTATFALATLLKQNLGNVTALMDSRPGIVYRKVLHAYDTPKIMEKMQKLNMLQCPPNSMVQSVSDYRYSCINCTDSVHL